MIVKTPTQTYPKNRLMVKEKMYLELNPRNKVGMLDEKKALFILPLYSTNIPTSQQRLKCEQKQQYHIGK